MCKIIERRITAIAAKLLAEDINPYKYDREKCLKILNKCVAPSCLTKCFNANEDAIIAKMKEIKG